MSRLFDSSSIYLALAKDKPELLKEAYTLTLARYEVENVIWKESHIFKRLDKQKALELGEIFPIMMDSMIVVNIKGHEKGILDLAFKLETSFYDASFVYWAIRTNSEFITEDIPLSKKAAKMIKCISFKDLV